jgi:transposase-like protein
MSGPKIVKRYSTAFRQKVVTEIETGKLTVPQARKLYDITGIGTIENWIKKLGKQHLLNQVVRIEMKDERDKLRQLEKEKRLLESALAQAQVKIICLEELIKCAETELNLDLKKNFGTQPPATRSAGSRR